MVLLKFQKVDNYNNLVFVIKSTAENESEYNKIICMYDKLLDMKLTTFLPIYHNTEHKYAKITFKNDSKHKLEIGVYDVKFDIAQHTYDGKQFCTCRIKSLKPVKQPRSNASVMFSCD